MPVATYQVGSPTRPDIQHDDGFLALDSCDGSGPGVTDYLVLGAWEVAYAGADTIRGHELADALAAYNHFLHGNGADRTISYERFIDNDGSGPTVLENAIEDAQHGAEWLVAQRFNSETDNFDFEITSSAITVGGETGFPYPATENWQKAIGGHPIWISAVVHVYQDAGFREYEMEFTLHMEDRYNFNPGQADIESGAPDSWNGQLSCTGLAHQYTNYATLT